ITGLLFGQVDSLDLLSLLNFKVLSHQNHSRVPFHIPICWNNYMKNKPIVCLILMVNEDPSINP
ncbi:Reverse transcriptase domain-containing protein, partial [Aphis craccivora]